LRAALKLPETTNGGHAKMIGIERGKRAGAVIGSRRIVCCVVVGAAAALGAGFLASSGAAGAATSRTSSAEVLHFFSQSQTMTFSTAAGKPFSPSKSNPPRAGDEIESTDLDYVGNHANHAASWTASDHLLCIIGTSGSPVCHAEIAIGSSMILLRGLATQSPHASFVVTGGTGRFKGVTGTLVSANISPSSDTSSSDLTIRLQRP
jgi:hypothetical protein